MWVNRLSLVLGELSRKNNKELTAVQLALLGRVAQAYGAPSPGFKKNYEMVVGMFDDLLDLYYRPFDTKKDPETRVVDEMTEAWVNEFGDPKDPEVASAIDDAVTAIYARSKKI